MQVARDLDSSSAAWMIVLLLHAEDRISFFLRSGRFETIEDSCPSLCIVVGSPGQRHDRGYLLVDKTDSSPDLDGAIMAPATAQPGWRRTGSQLSAALAKRGKATLVAILIASGGSYAYLQVQHSKAAKRRKRLRDSLRWSFAFRCDSWRHSWLSRMHPCLTSSDCPCMHAGRPLELASLHLLIKASMRSGNGQRMARR